MSVHRTHSTRNYLAAITGAIAGIAVGANIALDAGFPHIIPWIVAALFATLFLISAQHSRYRKILKFTVPCICVSVSMANGTIRGLIGGILLGVICGIFCATQNVFITGIVTGFLTAQIVLQIPYYEHGKIIGDFLAIHRNAQLPLILASCIIFGAAFQTCFKPQSRQ